MKSLEDLIDLSVVAPSIPPTFNDSPVIPIYDEVSLPLLIIGKIPDQAFKTDGFCPANVSLPIQCLPSWDKMPGSPLITNGDHNAEF